MEELEIDYFENSRRAILAQVDYATLNPQGFRGYDRLHWGFTASDGPGWFQQNADGTPGAFFGYLERGAPHGNDDGTIAPSAVLSSLPFAPDVVLPTIHEWLKVESLLLGECGFVSAFNPTYDPSRPYGWVGSEVVGIDQGPPILMIENFLTGFVWQLMREDPYVRRGLLHAGFSGGWVGRIE
jgi:hypothetical protein